VLVIASILLAGAAVMAIYGLRNGTQPGTNIAIGLAATAITLIVFHQLNQLLSRRKYKRQIIDQMGSAVNGSALEAVGVAGQNGWLRDGSLKGAFLVTANLSGADLGEADLQGAFLGEANLAGAILVKANLSGANLAKAKLSGANLAQANLEHVFLVEPNFQDAQCDGATRWPDGFDYRAAGVIPVDE